jgi:hypothetical protein
VLHTRDRGLSWTVVASPLVAGDAAGIASVAFRGPTDGVIAGGQIGEPDETTGRMARTEDGGRTWGLLPGPPFSGAVYGTAYVEAAGGTILVAVGPGGASMSRDDASTWASLDTLSYWGLGFADGVGWIAGPEGRLVKVRF